MSAMLKRSQLRTNLKWVSSRQSSSQYNPFLFRIYSSMPYDNDGETDREHRADTSSSESSTWNDMFQRLKAIYDTAGRTEPRLGLDHLEISLQQWVQNQRTVFSKFQRIQSKHSNETESSTDPVQLERWEKLRSIGLSFSKSDEKWNSYFHQLTQFHNQYRHFNILLALQHLTAKDPSFIPLQQLRRWVELQRTYKRRKDLKMDTPLTDDREQRLADLGLIFRPQDYLEKNPWLRQYRLLTSLLKQNRFPSGLADNPSLLRWIQRQHKYRHDLSTVQSNLLDEIHFFTDKTFLLVPKSYESWDSMVTELQKFRDQYGHCRVPQKFTTSGNPCRKLGHWVRAQRIQYRHFLMGLATPLTPQRIDVLNALHFEWTVYDKRDKNRSQKTTKQNSRLDIVDEESIHDMESAQMIQLLQDFKAQHGHTFVPNSTNTMSTSTSSSSSNHTHEPLSTLYRWLQKKRLAYQQYKMSLSTQESDPLLSIFPSKDANRIKTANQHLLHITEKEIQSLDALGFVWSLDENKWWETFHKQKSLSSQIHGFTPRNVSWTLSKQKLLSRSHSSSDRIEGTLPTDTASNSSLDALLDTNKTSTDISNDSNNPIDSSHIEPKDSTSISHPDIHSTQTITKDSDYKTPQDSDDLTDSTVDLLMTPSQQKWFKMFEALKLMYRQNESYAMIKDLKLKEWMHEQRLRYWKKNYKERNIGNLYQGVSKAFTSSMVNVSDELTEEEILALESISFPWNMEVDLNRS